MTISTKEKLEESIKVLESYFNQHSLKVDGGERKKMSEDLAFLFNDDNSVSYAVAKYIERYLKKLSNSKMWNS